MKLEADTPVLCCVAATPAPGLEDQATRKVSRAEERKLLVEFRQRQRLRHPLHFAIKDKLQELKELLGRYLDEHDGCTGHVVDNMRGIEFNATLAYDLLSCAEFCGCEERGVPEVD